MPKILQFEGELYHEKCLAETDRGSAREIAVDDIDSDQICDVCDDLFVENGKVMPGGNVDPDDED